MDKKSYDFLRDKELITAKDAEKLAEIYFGKDWEVIDFVINKYSDEKLGFLGSHKRLVITVSNKNETDCHGGISTIRFFVKFFPYEVPTQAEYVREKGVFQQETFFFENVVPELLQGFNVEPWAPECFLIKKDCLVFEELVTSGFGMRHKLFKEDEIRAALGTIARYHAASLHAEARLGRPLNLIYPDAFHERAFLSSGKQYRWYLAGIDVALEVAVKLGLDGTNLPLACHQVFEAIKPSVEKQNVASHGDLWSNNLMFDDSIPPRCRLVDFQLARYSPLGHDVAQFLYLCASRDFREKHAHKMLRHYYHSLENSLKEFSLIPVKMPPWRELELSYEEQKLGALVTAIMYFPTVLLDGRLGAEIMNDPESYEKFVTVDRRGTVLDNMERDPEYGQRICETVTELVEMSHMLSDLPLPC